MVTAAWASPDARASSMSLWASGPSQTLTSIPFLAARSRARSMSSRPCSLPSSANTTFAPQQDTARANADCVRSALTSPAFTSPVFASQVFISPASAHLSFTPPAVQFPSLASTTKDTPSNRLVMRPRNREPLPTIMARFVLPSIHSFTRGPRYGTPDGMWPWVGAQPVIPCFFTKDGISARSICFFMTARAAIIL